MFSDNVHKQLKEMWQDWVSDWEIYKYEYDDAKDKFDKAKREIDDLENLIYELRDKLNLPVFILGEE